MMAHGKTQSIYICICKVYSTCGTRAVSIYLAMRLSTPAGFSRSMTLNSVEFAGTSAAGTAESPPRQSSKRDIFGSHEKNLDLKKAKPPQPPCTTEARNLHDEFASAASLPAQPPPAFPKTLPSPSHVQHMMTMPVQHSIPVPKVFQHHAQQHGQEQQQQHVQSMPMLFAPSKAPVPVASPACTAPHPVAVLGVPSTAASSLGPCPGFHALPVPDPTPTPLPAFYASVPPSLVAHRLPASCGQPRMHGAFPATQVPMKQEAKSPVPASRPTTLRPCAAKTPAFPKLAVPALPNSSSQAAVTVPPLPKTEGESVDGQPALHVNTAPPAVAKPTSILRVTWADQVSPPAAPIVQVIPQQAPDRASVPAAAHYCLTKLGTPSPPPSALVVSHAAHPGPTPSAAAQAASPHPVPGPVVPAKAASPHPVPGPVVPAKAASPHPMPGPVVPAKAPSPHPVPGPVVPAQAASSPKQPAVPTAAGGQTLLGQVEAIEVPVSAVS